MFGKELRAGSNIRQLILSDLVTTLALIFLALAIALSVTGMGQEDPSKLGTIGGTLAAVAAALLAVRLGVMQHERDRSLFFLNSYVDGLIMAHDMLRQGNDRALWIAAGRILSRCEELGPLITYPEHRTVLEIRKDEYRWHFGSLLGAGNPDMTPAYFYGVDPGLGLQEAARASTTREGTVRSTVRQLDESSIHTVWRFAEFPAGYEDKLSGRFTWDELRRLRGSYAALRAFLEYSDAYQSVGGEIQRRDPPRRREGTTNESE